MVVGLDQSPVAADVASRNEKGDLAVASFSLGQAIRT
jgi:hypothetical protein